MSCLPPSLADFSFLFYAGIEPMWIFDIHSLKILDVNDAAIAIYGYTKEEFLTKTVTDLRPAADAFEVESRRDDILSSNINYRELRHQNRSGQIMHVKISSYPFQYNGLAARLVAIRNQDEIRAMTNKLQQTEKRLEKILNTTSIGFFQLDGQCIVTYWNKAAESLLSYQKEYVLGKNLWDVFPEATFSEFFTAINKALNNKVTVDFKEYFWPVQKWFSVSVYPIDEGVIIHFRDITEKQLAIEGLNEKIRQLKEISYLNSHHIRKPLASLLGLANLIREENACETEVKQLADYIYTCSLELDEAVNKVNKKVGNDELMSALYGERESFLFHDLLKESLSVFENRYLKHRFVLAEEEGITYYGNKESIRFVVEQLVDNAIKFSPDADKIIIQTQLINHNVVLSVKDFGVGMEEAELNTLFLKLTKRELQSNLAYVDDIVRRNNGSIWVESVKEKGSTFFVRFPLTTTVKDGEVCANISTSLGLDLNYNGAEGYLYANWYGFHSLYSVKAGGFKILDVIKKHKCSMLLNDNTYLMGSWESAAEWITSDFIPMAIQAGLKYVAWIYSPSTFSKMATDHTIRGSEGNITLRAFDSKTAGIQWLKEVAGE